MLPRRLVVTAEVLEGAAHGPVAEELVRVELERAPGLGELGPVLAAESVVQADEGRDDQGQRVQLFGPPQRPGRFVPAAAKVQDEAEPLVRSGGVGRQLDGATQLALGAVPVPILQEAKEAGRDVRFRNPVVEKERLPE